MSGNVMGKTFRGEIGQGASFGSQTVGNVGASDVCSGPSTERPPPHATAGEDLEREMVSSRLFLIARRCASRCNWIPTATRREGERTSRASVCAFPFLCVLACTLRRIYSGAMFRRALLGRRV